MSSYIVYRPNTKRSARVGYLADEFWNDRSGRWGSPRGASHMTEARARAVIRAQGGSLDWSAVPVDSKRNPCGNRRNPGAPRGGMLMGHLKELKVRLSDGSELTIRPSKQYIGWLPRSRQLAILTRRMGRVSNVPDPVRRLHRSFHNSDPQGASTFEWPDREGSLTDVGLIVSLLYTIPSWLKSPQKRRYQWNHEFGDRGERGHGTVRGSGNYPEKYMPLLQIDEGGHLFIKRRPGNKFYVKDWLYW